MSSDSQQVREVFLVPQDIHASTEQFLAQTSQSELELSAIAQSFAENLRGVVRILSIPFQYTYSQIHSLHWQRIYLAARIRGGGNADDTQQEVTDRANAKTNFHEYLKREGGQQIADEVIGRLLHLKSEPESLLAARELTRQGVVLTWSTVEVLARDAFVYLLNRRPQMVEQLLADPFNKKRFSKDRIDWQTLTEYGFDLSKSLGTYLASKADLSSLPAMRSAYSALFPSATQLRQSLTDERLWQLNQKRHLIVHRRGIVDKAFIEATGTTLSVGETLWVSPSEVEGAVEAALALGTQIMSEVKNVA